jgi:hypothetical protein
MTMVGAQPPKTKEQLKKSAATLLLKVEQLA